MFTNERQSRILTLVRLRGSVRLTEIATEVGVSTVTVRRDVAALAEEGLLERVHGGVSVLPGPTAYEGSPVMPAARRLGLVVPSADYYYPSVIEGCRAAAATLGARLTLGVSWYRAVDEQRQVQRLIELGVDGILLACSTPPDTDPATADWVASIPVPTVLVERQIDPDLAPGVESVRSDHVAGARIAVRHLAGLGHERVGLLAHAYTPTTRWLEKGVRDSAARGVIGEAAPPVVLSGSCCPPRDELAAVIRQIIGSGTRALVVHSDRLAIEVIAAAREIGFDIPNDLAVIAYDDEIAALADVPATAVRPPKRDVGRLAVEVALRRLAAADPPAPQRIALLPQLMVRSSCGASVLGVPPDGHSNLDPAA